MPGAYPESFCQFYFFFPLLLVWSGLRSITQVVLVHQMFLKLFWSIRETPQIFKQLSKATIRYCCIWQMLQIAQSEELEQKGTFQHIKQCRRCHTLPNAEWISEGTWIVCCIAGLAFKFIILPGLTWHLWLARRFKPKWESPYSKEANSEQICTKIKLEPDHLPQQHTISLYTGEGIAGNAWREHTAACWRAWSCRKKIREELD